MSWVGQMTVTGGLVNMPVTSADTGATYSVLLGPGEEHIQHLKQKLASLTTVPPEDQILLCGPPYKRMDSTFTRTPLTPGLRVFLYDRRLIQIDNSTLKQGSDQEAVFVEMPTEPWEMSDELKLATAGISGSKSTPLLQTVASYERQFMLALNKGQAFYAAAERRRDLCKRFWSEAQSQRDALSAAVYNLKDHAIALESNFDEVVKALDKQESRHQGLLDSFESDLAALGEVSLHPALIPNLSASLNASTSPKTLLDCVPVERERALVSACRESHRRVQTHLAQARAAWTEVSSGVEKLVNKHCRGLEQGQLESSSANQGSNSIELIVGPPMDEEALREGLSLLLGCVKRLENDYQLVSRLAIEQFKAAASRDMQQSGSSVIALVQDLDDKFTAQADISSSMQQIDDNLKELSEAARQSKIDQNRTLRMQLKEVSSLQSRIQEMQKWLNLMRHAKEQKEEQFSHLEKVRRMPSAHSALLSEVIRRRAYNAVVSARANVAAEEAAALRSAEIVARDTFLRRDMVNLPVAFMDAAPALSRMPPRFIPTVNDPDDHALPDIRNDGGELDNFALLAMLTKRKTESLNDNDDYSSKKDIPKGSIIIQAGGEGDDDDDDDDGENASKSEAEMAVQNAELLYQNAILRNEILRLQSIVKRHNPLCSLTPPIDKSTFTSNISYQYQSIQVNPEMVIANTQTDFPTTVQTTTLEPKSAENLKLNDDTEKNSKSLSEALSLIESTVQKWFVEERIPAPDTLSTVPNSSKYPTSSAQDIASVVDRALKAASQRLKGNAAEIENRVCTAARAAGSGRISFRDFIEGDLALFLPTTDGSDRIYLAFHIGCPYYYLAQESVDEICKQLGRFPDFILGRIIMVERFSSAENEPNLYDVPIGKMYYILTATSF